MRCSFRTVYVGQENDVKLEVTADVRPKGLATVPSPLLRVFLRRELAKKYETVKQVGEAESNPSSS